MNCNKLIDNALVNNEKLNNENYWVFNDKKIKVLDYKLSSKNK